MSAANILTVFIRARADPIEGRALSPRSSSRPRQMALVFPRRVIVDSRTAVGDCTKVDKTTFSCTIWANLKEIINFIKGISLLL